MGVHVYLLEDAVDVNLSGLDSVLSLKSELHLPYAVIERAYVASQADLKQDLGWRVGGSYWPGSMACGHYTVKHRKGARQLWCAYRDPEVLVLDTTLERPCRVVVQHPERAQLAARIERSCGR